MLSPEKLATPATAATVLVPDKVPVLGFVPIATVIFPVNPVAVLPLPSWAVTSTAGVIAVPAVVVLGCTLNTNCVAEPEGMLNRALVVLPAPVSVSVQPVRTLSMLSPDQFSTSVAAAAVRAFPTRRSSDLVPIATVIFPVNPVAVLPLPSWAVTSTAGVIAVPAVVVLGCTLNTNCVAE